MKESNFNATMDCFGRSAVVFGSSIVSADEDSHCPSEFRCKIDKWGGNNSFKDYFIQSW